MPWIKNLNKGDFIEVQVTEVNNMITSDEIFVKYFVNDEFLGQQKFDKSNVTTFKFIFNLGKKGQKILINQADCQRLQQSDALFKKTLDEQKILKIEIKEQLDLLKRTTAENTKLKDRVKQLEKVNE